ncbi:acyl-CoA dehydrogenase family protein, partial [Nocardia farcinica]|uniref:acyl-CoA dehydrogenase family protein n=1 Tax=Nocardia farcinica TaxID=37329 RepID=UPI002457A4D9
GVDDRTFRTGAGERAVRVGGAVALLAGAARAVDAAAANPTEESAAEASIAVAAAKVAAVRAALAATNGLFELGGTSSATAAANLSRYWRDARTHTLHDPTRWKVQHIGRHTLTGAPPPRHGQI